MATTSNNKMATSNINPRLFPSLLLSALTIIALSAADPDILTDYTAPADPASLNGTFFTYTAFRGLLGAGGGPSLNVTKASVAEFPALEGQSVSLAFLEFPGGAINPPHTHPRAAELLFLLQGTLEVTLVDTKGAAYAQLLRAGDIFVFPKGLLHLQYNKNHKEPAVAVSAFAGVNAGTVSVPKAVFGAGIDDLILAKAFNTDVATVQKIKSGLANP